MTAAAASVPPVRHHRDFNHFTPSFPRLSGAHSSSAGGAGPVTRAFSLLRSTPGDASLGSLNNNLHHMPPSLSADPPLHPQPIPTRNPPSPIPHLHHSSFANNSSFHQLASLTNLNRSPSSMARQSPNYSPNPPPTSAPPTSNPLPGNNSTQGLPSSQPHVTSAPPSQNISPATIASQRHAPNGISSHQPAQPTLHVPQAKPAVVVPPSAAHAPPPTSDVAAAQGYGSYASGSGVGRVHIASSGYQGCEGGANGAGGVSSGPGSVVTTVLVSSDGQSQIGVEKRGKETPAKRTRTGARQTQLSPTTPKSAAGTGAWGGQTGYSGGKRRSNGEVNGHTNGGGEEQSRPERKREREKRRRETMNTRFNELASCLVIAAGGKSDKESILAEAVEYVKKQAKTIEDLRAQNRELQSEASDLRAEKTELRQDKNYLREERDKYKKEVERLESELNRKRQRTDRKDEGEAVGVVIKRERKLGGRETEIQA
eukprot:GFKZ01013416.1.p1 GENE.GFKZ01013416.1~~GFKZ01013416.1.p1  ORF type:complete len:564 (+),score=79.33 GFKZ01013416.1:242-1693(+)